MNKHIQALLASTKTEDRLAVINQMKFDYAHQLILETRVLLMDECNYLCDQWGYADQKIQESYLSAQDRKIFELAKQHGIESTDWDFNEKIKALQSHGTPTTATSSCEPVRPYIFWVRVHRLDTLTNTYQVRSHMVPALTSEDAENFIKEESASDLGHLQGDCYIMTNEWVQHANRHVEYNVTNWRNENINPREYDDWVSKTTKAGYDSLAGDEWPAAYRKFDSEPKGSHQNTSNQIQH